MLVNYFQLFIFFKQNVCVSILPDNTYFFFNFHWSRNIKSSLLCVNFIVALIVVCRNIFFFCLDITKIYNILIFIILFCYVSFLFIKILKRLCVDLRIFFWLKFYF